jgi:3-dehydroquinate dehydratase-2
MVAGVPGALRGPSWHRGVDQGHSPDGIPGDLIVDAFHAHIDDVDGALINAAGLTFSSVSIHDAIKAMPFPVIEVHISNLATRDEIHQRSVLTPAVRGAVMGLGWRSYTAAMRALVELVREERAATR